MELSKKSRAVALVLALFLGGFGAHRFYVGKIGSAIAILLLTITIVCWWVGAIWVLVDFIMILIGTFTDKNGAKLLRWGDTI